MEKLELLDLIKKDESSSNIYTERQVIPTSRLDDIDLKAFKKCLYQKYYEKLTASKFSMEQMLKLPIDSIFEKLDLNLPFANVLQNMGLADYGRKE
jgi:predicted HTH transcriptional regulator